jgi:Cu(I)/Ag(I) efflux system periplasmic protein CusF
MKRVFLACILLFSLPTFAQADEKHHQPGAADGEVRKVDRDAQKLTIRHGPLPQFDMPQPMTMVYRVKDVAMLDRVKPGDKVKFRAEKIGGAFTIVEIEAAR